LRNAPWITVRRAGISLLLRATCTCPRTTPRVWSSAATHWACQVICVSGCCPVS